MPLPRSLQRLLIPALLLALLLTPLARADAPGTDTPAPGSTPTGPTDLRCLWHAGQTSRYRTASSHITAVQILGQKEIHSSALQIKSEFTWKVLQANPDGGGTCSLTVDHAAIAITGPDGKAQLVTADKAPDDLQPVQQFIKAQLGVPVTITVDPSGQISSATGWQTIKSNSGEVGKNLIEKDFIQMAWELAPLANAPSAARENAHWSSPLDIDHELGTTHLDSSYTFAGVESMAGIPVAMINRTSKVSFTPDTSRVPLPPGESINIELKKSEMRSQIMFDLSRHEVAGQNIDRLELYLITLTKDGRNLQQARQERYNTQVLRITED